MPENTEIDLYYDGTCSRARSTGVNDVLAALDATGRTLLSANNPGERFRQYPLLQTNFVEKIKGGPYSLDQVCRFLELHLLDLPGLRTKNKNWTPTLLLVPLASFSAGSLSVDHKIIYDPSISDHQYLAVKPYIRLCVEKTAAALAAWLFASGLRRFPPDLSRLPLAVNENLVVMPVLDSFERELEKTFFSKPLTELYGFTPENAAAYSLPRFTESVVSLLADGEFIEAQTPESVRQPVYGGKNFLITIEPDYHVLNSLSNAKPCDLVHHYAAHLYALAENIKTPRLAGVLPDSRTALSLASGLPDRDTLEDGALGDLIAAAEPLTVFAKEAYGLVLDPGHEYFFAFEDVRGLIRRLVLLHQEVRRYQSFRLNVLMQMRYDEMRESLAREDKRLTSLDGDLFQDARYREDRAALGEMQGALVTRVSALPGVRRAVSSGKEYYAADKNLASIYAFLVGHPKAQSLPDLRKQIEAASVMLGSLMNEESTTLDRILTESGYPPDKAERIKKAWVRAEEERLKRQKQDEPSADPRTRLPLAAGAASFIVLLVPAILVGSTPGRAAIAVVLALAASAGVFLLVSRALGVRSRERVRAAAKETVLRTLPVFSRGQKKTIQTLLERHLPHEAASQRALQKYVLEDDEMKKFFQDLFPYARARTDRVDDAEFANTVINALLSNGLLVELPVLHYVVPERWEDSKVRESYRREMRRLQKTGQIDGDLFNLSVQCAEYTFTAEDVKRYMKKNLSRRR